MTSANAEIAVLQSQMQDVQTELAEVKADVKLVLLQLTGLHSSFLTKEEYLSRHVRIEQRIDQVQRLVYIGLGGILMAEFFVRFLLK